MQLLFHFTIVILKGFLSAAREKSKVSVISGNFYLSYLGHFYPKRFLLATNQQIILHLFISLPLKLYREIWNLT